MHLKVHAEQNDTHSGKYLLHRIHDDSPELGTNFAKHQIPGRPEAKSKTPQYSRDDKQQMERSQPKDNTAPTNDVRAPLAEDYATYITPYIDTIPLCKLSTIYTI